VPRRFRQNTFALEYRVEPVRELRQSLLSAAFISGARLRKLETKRPFIKTIRSVGYQFLPSPQAEAPE